MPKRRRDAKPRRSASAADIAARAVRKEHRPPRSWPPVVGGLLAAAALVVPRLPAGTVPAVLAGPAPVLGYAAAGMGLLGVFLCRGVPRWMSGLLVAACVLFAAAG